MEIMCDGKYVNSISGDFCGGSESNAVCTCVGCLKVLKMAMFNSPTPH